MKLLSTAEAAARLGMKVRAVQLLIANGTLPAQRVGKSLVIAEKDLKRAENRPRTGRPKKQDATPPRRRPPVGRAS
jgi:excisionase family DNA binding protein